MRALLTLILSLSFVSVPARTPAQEVISAAER